MSTTLKPPIFLLGNVRSGTTMIQRLFGLHPEVATWFEPRTVWAYGAPARKHDRFDERDASPRVIKYIRTRFEKYQIQYGGRRIMEKTPSNVMRIPYVHAIFPEARFVYLVREPLAHLSSAEKEWRKLIRRGKAWKRLKEVPKSQIQYYAWRALIDFVRKRILREDYVSVWGVRYPGIYEDLHSLPIEHVIAKQWALCSRQAEDDLEKINPDLVIRVRYEDFVTAPVREFDKILAHFGLEMTPEIQRAILETIDPSRQQKWKRMPSGSLAACLPILEKEMDRHGYCIPSELEDAFLELS